MDAFDYEMRWMFGFNSKNNKKNMSVRELLGWEPVSLFKMSRFCGLDVERKDDLTPVIYEDGDRGNQAEGMYEEDLMGLFQRC